MPQNAKMMCPIFIKVFAELFSKSDSRPFYLLASSMATATGAVILSLLVVTCVEASCFYGEQERYN